MTAYLFAVSNTVHVTKDNPKRGMVPIFPHSARGCDKIEHGWRDAAAGAQFPDRTRGRMMWWGMRLAAQHARGHWLFNM